MPEMFLAAKNRCGAVTEVILEGDKGFLQSHHKLDQQQPRLVLKNITQAC